MKTEERKLVEVEVLPAGQVTVLPTERQRLVWARSLLHNRKALFGLIIAFFFIGLAILAPVIAPSDPSEFVARPHQPPSAEHWFGTEGHGKDVFSQTLWGARISLMVGFTAGLLTTIVGMVVGMTAGFFRGKVDDILSLMMNVFLVIPGLPLLVVIAAYLKPGLWVIILALAFTGWAWPARIMRSQTLSLREKDFVSAATVSGESNTRIIFRGIVPNMASIIVGSFIGSVTYAIATEAALSVIGLTNVSQVSWGTNLYWAQNNAGLLVGAWWTFLPSGLCIAMVAFGLSLLNYGMDEVTNPRLRAEKDLNNVLKDRSLRRIRNVRATPVLRRTSDSAGQPTAT